MNVAVYTNVVIRKDPKGISYIEEITNSEKKKRVDVYYDKKYKKIANLPDGTRIKMITGTFEPEQPFKVIFSSAHTNLDDLELGMPLEAADDYGYAPPFLRIIKIKVYKRTRM